MDFVAVPAVPGVTSTALFKKVGMREELGLIANASALCGRANAANTSFCTKFRRFIGDGEDNAIALRVSRDKRREKVLQVMAAFERSDAQEGDSEVYQAENGK